MFDTEHLISKLHFRLREQIIDLTSNHCLDQICVCDPVYIVGSDILGITEYGNSGSQTVHIFETVRNKDNGNSICFQLVNQCVKLLGLVSGKCCCWLIQNDDLRICGKCLGDLNHLLLRNRKGTHLSGCIEICIQLFEVFVRLLIHFFPLDHMMFDDLMTHKNIFSYCKVRV